MLIFSKYKTLFKVTIYHDYFLNNGEEDFMDLDEKQRQDHLKNYDWRHFLQVKPTGITKELMTGHKLFLKEYPTGFSIAVKVESDDEKQPFISLDTFLELTFTLKFIDPQFMNYTDFSWPDHALFYIANKQPDVPEPHSIDLVSLDESAHLVSENHWLTGENRTYLLSQMTKHQSGPMDGLFKIHLTGENGQYNVISNQGKLKNNPLHFWIRFKNKSTFWKYIHQSKGFETETKKAWPLTQKGFIQLDPQTDLKSPPAGADNYSYPNPVPGTTKSKANKTYSEIFI